MKILRLLALTVSIILMLSLFSCDQLHLHTGKGSSNSKDPHDQHQPPSDNEENEGGEGKVTYVYSVISKVLHLPDCYHIDRIKEEYKFEYTGDITVMFEKGYTVCKDCLAPDEPEEEPEEEEEDPNKVAKEDATYLINSSSNKFHKLDCYHIEGMSEKNIKYTDLSIEELIALEHRPCATCFPDEAEEWEKNHPDEKK